MAAILGNSDDTECASQRLGKSQPEGYQFLFASTTPGRGTSGWLIRRQAMRWSPWLSLRRQKGAGPGMLAAHELRRMLITIGQESGGHVKDLQDQAGHVQAATTLRYGQALDARKRREKIKLPFA